MKIVRFAIDPRADRPAVDLSPIGPGWNVFTGPLPSDLSSAAGLATHLALGRESRQPRHWSNGSIVVDAGHGDEYRITRDERHERLIRRLGVDESIGGPALETWRAGASFDVLGQFFGPVRADSDDAHTAALDAILSTRVAEAINKLRAGARGAVAGFESHEALVRRRDVLLTNIESFYGSRRTESAAIESQLAALDGERADLATKIESLRETLRRLDAQLGEAESRTRYLELARIADEAELRRSGEGWSARLEELDAQVALWRQTLDTLEGRLAELRSRLAQWRPDDASPEVALADQRSGLAVAIRLIADLESEVSRFALTADSPHCMCQGAHARLNPLVETLGRHLSRVGQLVDQQDHALLGRSLHAEAEQVERSRAEVRRQVDALLDQRETLLKASRAHDPRREGFVDDTPFDLEEVESRRAQVVSQLKPLEDRSRQLEGERTELQTKRSRLLDSTDLREWQAELDAVQARLGAAPNPDGSTLKASLRASELLAQLSDGELVELKLTAGGRDFIATRRSGDAERREELTSEENLLVLWALRLALVDWCSSGGVALPIILDEPFCGLNDRHTANLVTALDDLRRAGKQVLLFTQREAALDRLRSLGVTVRRLGEPVAAPPPAPAVVEPVKVMKTKQVVIEEPTGPACLLDVDDPIEKFPVPIRERTKVFGRARVRTVGDLVGADPSAVAEELGLEGVTAELVSLWQTHLALVCFVPGLTFADAKALAHSGVLCAEDLAESDSESLSRRLREAGYDIDADRVSEWIELSSDSLDRWESAGFATNWRRNSVERRRRIRENQNRSPREPRRTASSERNQRKRRTRYEGGQRVGSHGIDAPHNEAEGTRRAKLLERNRRSEETGPRFYLELTDDIEAAPSIGPKRAAQLTKIGVATVAALIAADPEDIAERLDHKRIDAERVRTWIKQSKLMLRVPGLRGHDAQLLVGVEHDDPQLIATMTPAALLAVVDPYCDTKEGQRYLRGGHRPDLEEVTDWIGWAAQRRELSAV